MSELRHIGVIHSPYRTKDECPIQGRACPDVIGRVEVFAEYEEGLLTIETFSHIMLFYIFDRAGEVALARPTFLDDQPHGVFASRHPCRPSGLGFSIVRLVSRNSNMLEVAGVDVLDGTPLVDIKPYIPKFDGVQDATDGWLEGRAFGPKPEGRE